MRLIPIKSKGRARTCCAQRSMLLRQLILWMQKRIDEKDVLLAEQYAKALEVSSSVIRLASETGQKTTAALDALTAGIVDMRREICVRLERMEGGGGKG